MKEYKSRFNRLCAYILLLMGCCGLFDQPLQAQNIAIPDSTFEAQLVRDGMDSDHTVNGQMAQSDALAIVGLVLDSSITDVTGLRHFINLQSLVGEYSKISVLNVTGMPNLAHLDMHDSHLQQLQADSLPQLARCFVQGCTRLSRLTLTDNPSLEEVNASSCRLLRFSIVRCPMLERLDVSNNLLHVVQPTDLSHAVELNLYNNPLMVLDLDVNNLSSLFVSNALLTALDLSNTPNLRRLNMHMLPITDLQFPSPNRLESIIMRNVRLDSLDVSGANRLYLLESSFGHLVYLNASNCPVLRYIKCQHNYLLHLDVFGTPMLESLDASVNKLVAFNVSSAQGAPTFNLRDNNLRFLQTIGPVIPTTGTPSILLDNNDPALEICVNAQTFNWRYLPRSAGQYSFYCDTSSLYGTLHLDLNYDCLAQPFEPLVAHSLLRITDLNNTLVSYASADSNNLYYMFLDTGNYQLDWFERLPYRVACTPRHSVTITPQSQLDTLDLGVLQITSFCHYLEVFISAPFIRSTGTGSAYTVNYCNLGTANVYNAYVEVSLDPGLQVTATSIPIQSQQGNVYRFDVDTVTMGACHSFTIQVVSNADLPVGHIICSEAHIYPDTLCGDPWMGPIVSTTHACESDSVIFYIRNKGGAMSAPQTFNVFEDQVMLHTGSYQLNAGDSMRITCPIEEGNWYRIEAKQPKAVPLYMAPTIAHSNARACSEEGAANAEALLSYYHNTSLPWVDIDCQALIAAYDPNDKTPSPVGYGSDHLIERNIPLDYRVRFQNTGNDTAFTVVVVDTLSPHVDVTTLQMQGASHPYQWSISGAGILTVTFANIRLVDSSTNEPLSHGYFTYTIQQNNNLDLGTRIENQAAIYFDYNAPIFTNTTWHTIGEFFRPSRFAQTLENLRPTVIAKPNPFEEQTTFFIEGGPAGDIELMVYDALGRAVATVSGTDTQYLTLERGNLPAGFYTYVLRSQGQQLNTGKLIVQ